MSQHAPNATPPDNPAGSYIADLSPNKRLELVGEIEQLPMKLRLLVNGFATHQLDTKYKNWTIRQIVHHLADSHLNGYLRTKLALTEALPTIKPYDESKWSQLPDATTLDVDVSLRMLEAVHARWAAVWRMMSPTEFERAYFHPELGRAVPLAETIGLYAWHGRHHSEMIVWLRAQYGWAL